MQPIAADSVPEPMCRLLDATLGREWRGGSLQLLPGTTNWVARLDRGDEALVLRLPQLDDTVLRVDRESECAILAAVAEADVGPQVLACEPDSGALITRWIAGLSWTREQAVEPVNIDRIGKLLRRLHELPVPAGARKIELPQIIAHYLAVLDQRTSHDLAGLSAMRAQADRRLASSDGRRRAVLCHNDAHHLNIVDGGRVHLIDWEYAGSGDPYFDLAAYARYHALDEAGCERLLTAHGESFAAGQREQFAAQCWLFDYIRALWAAVAELP